MEDIMTRYKIPGWRVKTRTYVITDKESVQVRLDLASAAHSINTSVEQPGMGLADGQ